MTTFKDILKKGFLDEFVAKTTLMELFITFAGTFFIAICLYFIYRYVTKNAIYSRTFNISMSLLCMVTALIIITIKSNVVLSLGMVGALSIVRFRTAIKEPMDLFFLFWSISLGIVMGAQAYMIGVAGLVAIGVSLLLFTKLPSTRTNYLVVVRFTDDKAEEKILECLRDKVRTPKMKNKTVSASFIEVTYEVKLAQANSRIANDLKDLKSVTSAVMVTFDGEYFSA